MEISKRWRIVPQLWLAFLLHSAGAFAAPTDLPAAPKTVEQARLVLQQLDGLNSAAMAHYEQQKAACTQRVLISNCTRDVDMQISRYRRDVKVLENQARELIRVDEQQAKEAARLRNPPAPTPPDTSPLRADDPDIPSRRSPKPVPATDPASPTAQQEGSAASAPSDKPVLSEKEQADNRAAYERKIEQARIRQAENERKRLELEKRREAYQQEQAEKARRAEQQAQRRAAQGN